MTATATHAFSLRSEGGGAELVKLAPGDVVTVGRDARNRAQIGHSSIELFHATLRCDDWGVWIAPLPGAAVVVAGERASQERVVPLGAIVELGALRFELAASELVITPAALRSRGVRHLLEYGVAIVASAALHLVALWILSRITIVGEAEPETFAVRFTRSAPPSDELVPVTPPSLPETTPEEDVVPDLEPLLGSTVPDLEPAGESAGTPLGDDFDALPGPIHIGVGPGSGGGAGKGGSGMGGTGISGAGTLSLEDTSGLSRGFVTRLTALRGVGVDLVFVIDVTSSMRPFLEGARAAADKLVSTLAVVVSDLRVGIVAYRDKNDEFVTRILPLSADRYAILNFLWGLQAEGGGDVPEAVAAGLEEATGHASWRPNTHHVIVVVGDAPPHAQDWSRVKTAAIRFARADSIPGAVISAIYTGLPHASSTTAEEDGASALAEIARLGHGDYLDLGSSGDVGERLLLLTLGPKHASELPTLLSRVREGPREQLVRKHAEERDTAWLLSKLRRPPVHPAVVDALIRLADRDVLWAARQLVADPRAPRESREAALYLLRRIFPAAAELELDGDPERQRELMNRLDALILRR